MKPFLAGRPRHDHSNTGETSARPASASGLARLHEAHAATAQNPSAGAGGPSVECVKQGDKVVRLIVTCACGERIEIDCLYPL